MQEINSGSYVILKDTGEVGEVIEKRMDPLSYRVRSRGNSATYYHHDIIGLTPAQILVLNQALVAVAQVIDDYHGDDVYDPVYTEEGRIQYSSAAAAVFRALEFPRVIVELGALSDKVAILQQTIENLRGGSHD